MNQSTKLIDEHKTNFHQFSKTYTITIRKKAALFLLEMCFRIVVTSTFFFVFSLGWGLVRVGGVAGAKSRINQRASVPTLPSNH